MQCQTKKDPCSNAEHLRFVAKKDSLCFENGKITYNAGWVLD